MIFDDGFTGTTLDSSKWNTYITSRAANGWPWFDDGSGGSGIGAPGGNDAEYDYPSQVSVNNGLNLTAIRYAGYAGYTWKSGVVCTYGKLQFNGGYVQVKAKMPPGNGMWPAIWMLPGPGGASGDDWEIDIFEGGNLDGAVNPQHVYQGTLIHTPTGTYQTKVDAGVDLTAAYHVYGMKWVSGTSVTWYFDGAQVGTITSGTTPIPNEPMELILSNEVATSATSAWHTVWDASTPSPSRMSVAEVQVYQ